MGGLTSGQLQWSYPDQIFPASPGGVRIQTGDQSCTLYHWAISAAYWPSWFEKKNTDTDTDTDNFIAICEVYKGNEFGKPLDMQKNKNLQ